MQEVHCSLDNAKNFLSEKKMTYGRWIIYFKNSKFILRPDFGCSIDTGIGKSMYLKIGLPLKELHGTTDTLCIKR